METVLNMLGLFLSPIVQYAPIFSIILPYALFEIATDMPFNVMEKFDDVARRNYRDRFLNAALSGEKALYSSKNHAIMRGFAASKPGFSRFLAKGDPSSTDVLDNYPPDPSKIRIVNRNRSYDQVPLCIVIYILGSLIMNDAELRNIYLVTVNAAMHVPAVWNEMNKSHRDGVIGEFVFTNQLNREDWKTFLTQMGLIGSFWDPEWLAIPSNMMFVMQEFQTLRTADGNYVKFEAPVTLPMNAGYQVSASAIDTTNDRGILKARFHSGHVVPVNAIQVYALDAIFLSRELSDTRFKVTKRVMSCPEIGLQNYTSTSVLSAVVKRVDGTLTNSSPTYPPVADVAETPARVRPNAGRKANARDVVAESSPAARKAKNKYYRRLSFIKFGFGTRYKD